jgi:hypothetical protein
MWGCGNRDGGLLAACALCCQTQSLVPRHVHNFRVARHSEAILTGADEITCRCVPGAILSES